MKRLNKSLFAFILCVLILVPLMAQEEKAVDHRIGKKTVSVVPDTMLRGYDPVTVFFPGNRGPAKGGSLDQPGKLFQIRPPHPGQYRWLDARTLQFLPTTPWPALERYTVNIDGREFKLATLMAAPKDITPGDGETNLEPIKEFNLSFTHRIAPERLARMITFEVRPLPGVGKEDTQWLTARNFIIKEMERVDANQPVRYRVTLHKPVGYGKRLILHLRLSLESGIPGSLSRYTFSTKPLFRITAVGTGGATYPIASDGSNYTMDQAMDCGAGRSRLFLRFSDSLGAVSLEQVKEMVRFEPAVRNFRHQVSGGAIWLMFDADRDKPYKLRVRYIPVKSSSGRTLSRFGVSSVYFFYRQASPYLKWLAARGIIERYGPQVFPMEGRGTEQVDLRIYKINPLNRNFWPFPQDPVTVNESKRPAGPGEEPAYAERMKEQLKLAGSPLVSRVVPLPLKSGTGRRFGIDLRKHLEKISGPGQPGTYLVGYRVIGTGAQRHYVRVQVTDLSLGTVEEEAAVVFVVSSLKTGAPVAGAAVELQAVDESGLVTIIKGVTGSAGMFRYEHKEETQVIGRIFVHKGSDYLVLDPDSPPPHFTNNHWYNSYDSWLKWLYREPRSKKKDFAPKGHILTERPVYRPEEPVHIKGYVRLRQQGKIKLDHRDRKHVVKVNGPGGKEWVLPVKLTEYGSFYCKFDEKDLPTGEYNANLRDMKDDAPLASVEFKKEAYRIPRFEVRLSSPDRVALDQPFKVNLNAGYYAGGPVVGQHVQWRVTRFPYRYRLPGYEGFTFSTDKRISGGDRYYSHETVTKDDTTDENGAAFIDIDPTKEDDAGSRRYVVEATVRGADEQTVTATRRVLAVSPFTLGLKLDRFTRSGMALKPRIIIVDHNGKLMPGKKFHLRLLQRQWHSHLQESDFTTGKAKYVTDVVDQTVFEDDYQSEDKIKTLSLPIKEAGVYIVEISARDKQGRLQKVQVDLYAAGDTPVAWKKPKTNVFETTAGKRAYDPGDTAAIVLKSPFQDAHALAVVEGPSGNSYHWVRVSKGQAVFRLNIKGDMHPNIPVHFLLMRGRLPGKIKRLEAGREDRAKPIAMANTIWLRVNPKDNRLVLSLDHKKKCLPGSKLKVDIKMTTPGGKPLNGEVTLWLVDRAVLALGKEKRLDPLPSFIEPNASWIRIRETRNEVVGNLSPEEIAGGDVGEEGEEPSIFDRVTVRKNFKTVPYFNPNIQVRDGMAIVEIDLPDNLTDFAVRAVATDGGGRFGAAKSMVSVRLPVIVQTALPRFVRPGDEFKAGGIGRIVEGEGGPGRGEIETTGLVLEGENVLPIDWVKGQPEKVFFPFKTPMNALDKHDGKVTVKLAVKRDTDEAMDAFQVQLPVRPDTGKIRSESFGLLKKGKLYRFPIPKGGARPGTMKQTLVVTPEPALLKMLAGLNFLARYRHGCTEQRISKIYPELALQQVMKKIGREVHKDKMNRVLKDTFTYLEACLKPNGLYSYWPGSRGYVSLTAYVAEFLLEAKKQGYTFKPELLDRSLTALKEALRSDYRYFIKAHSFTERAEALAALAKAGLFDDAYANELATRASNMDLYSEAKILYTMLSREKVDRKAVEPLKKDLWKSIVFKLRDGKEVFDGMQFRQSSWGGLVLSSEVRTIAAVARALFKAEPDNPRVRLLINHIIERGDGDGWGSTSANAAALLALNEVLSIAQPRDQAFKLETLFGNTKKVLNTRGKIVSRISSTDNTPATFKLIDGPKDKPLMAWLITEYVPTQRGDLSKAQNNGFVVNTTLHAYTKKDAPPTQFPATANKTLTLDMGTIIEQHTQIINASTHFYVAIECPFAAGFEPLNPNLATAPPEATPSRNFTKKPDYAIYADNSVTFYFDQLPKGTYNFYFRLRASTQGTFTHPPTKTELMYQLPTFGTSDGTRILINPRVD